MSAAFNFGGLDIRPGSRQAVELPRGEPDAAAEVVEQSQGDVGPESDRLSPNEAPIS